MNKGSNNSSNTTNNSTGSISFNLDDIDLSKEKIIDIPIEESDYELLSDEEIDNYIKEIENSKEKINEEN